MIQRVSRNRETRGTYKKQFIIYYLNYNVPLFKTKRMSKKTSVNSPRKPVVCFLDIETSLAIVGTFSLYPESINHENIIQDWYIMSAAWKFQGSKKVYSTSVNDFKQKSPDDDYGVVRTLREALEGVDIVCTHNGDKFDMKKITARLIVHSLPPLPPLISIDTLKAIKKVANFTSHRLDFLGKKLVGEGKLHNSPGLWMRCLKGEKKAIDELVAYNRVDVIRLEQVYDRIRPYMKNPPNFSAQLGYTKDEHNCKSCGSHNVKLNGIRFTASGIQRQEIKCKDCHGYSSYPMYKVK